MQPATGVATRAAQPINQTMIGRFNRLPRFIRWGAASLALSAILWQGAIWLNVLPAEYFPGIPQLLSAWAALFVESSFWVALGQTLYSSFVGLLLSALVGIPIGVAIGRNEYLFHALQFPLEFLRPIPTVAFIPLVVLILGSGMDAKILLVFIAAVFPILVQTTYGVRDVDPVAFDTAQTYRFGPFRRLFCVLLPAASPYIMTGIRVSASISLLLSVATEIIIGSPGLGRAIFTAQIGNDLATMYALIAMTGFVGIGINALVIAFESRITAWARTGAEGA